MWTNFIKNGEKVLHQELFLDEWLETMMNEGRELLLSLITAFLEEAGLII